MLKTSHLTLLSTLANNSHMRCRYNEENADFLRSFCWKLPDRIVHCHDLFGACFADFSMVFGGFVICM